MGLNNEVAVVGMGCTKFGELWDKDVKDLVVDACYEAFDDAGITSKDIDAAWWSTMYSGEMGRSLAYPLKLDYIPVTRVENRCSGGQDAFINACFSVAAGAYETVLVCGAEKLKDSGIAAAGIDPSTPYTHRGDIMFVPPGAFAQIAQRYFHHYGIDPKEGKEALAKIAVKNHHNGSLTPKAQFQKEITIEQVLKAPMIAPPLGLFDCCGVSDGSAAAIVTTVEKAKKMKKDFVVLKGFGVSVGHYQASIEDDWQFTFFEETKRAAQMAYKMAGVTDPRKEIDVAIVHDCFTITELIIYEDLGFSEAGKAIADVDKGAFELTGDVAVNSDGGLKCFGHPVGASGIRMLYEVYNQLMGRAEGRQLDNPKLGLAHGVGGTPIDSSTGVVVVLGKPD
jgi:acetyl-CoA C-acetyltransferase